MIESIKVKISEGEILVLKSKMLIHPRDLERIQTNIARQRESGIITIPNGFDYEIVQVNNTEMEGDE